MKIISKLVLLFTFFLSFCSSASIDEIYGDWLAVHIFIDGKEILENDFEETGWFPKHYKTKPFYIMKGFQKIDLKLGWHDDPPVKADFSNNPENFEIFNATDERFNGVYQKTIETDTVMQEGVKTVYYFLTLESERNKILAVRNKAIFK